MSRKKSEFERRVFNFILFKQFNTTEIFFVELETVCQVIYGGCDVLIELRPVPSCQLRNRVVEVYVCLVHNEVENFVGEKNGICVALRLDVLLHNLP